MMTFSTSFRPSLRSVSQVSGQWHGAKRQYALSASVAQQQAYWSRLQWGAFTSLLLLLAGLGWYQAQQLMPQFNALGQQWLEASGVDVLFMAQEAPVVTPVVTPTPEAPLAKNALAKAPLGAKSSPIASTVASEPPPADLGAIPTTTPTTTATTKPTEPSASAGASDTLPFPAVALPEKATVPNYNVLSDSITKLAKAGYDPFSVALPYPASTISWNEFDKLNPFYKTLITANPDIKIVTETQVIAPNGTTPTVTGNDTAPTIKPIVAVPKHPAIFLTLSGISYMPKKPFAMFNLVVPSTPASSSQSTEGRPSNVVDAEIKAMTAGAAGLTTPGNTPSTPNGASATPSEAKSIVATLGTIINTGQGDVKVVNITSTQATLLWVDAPPNAKTTLHTVTLPSLVGYSTTTSGSSGSNSSGNTNNPLDETVNSLMGKPNSGSNSSATSRSSSKPSKTNATQPEGGLSQLVNQLMNANAGK
jgi:hypothetical protein